MTFKRLCGATVIVAGTLTGLAGPVSAQLASPYYAPPYASPYGTSSAPTPARTPASAPLPYTYMPPQAQPQYAPAAQPYTSTPLTPPLPGQPTQPVVVTQPAAPSYAPAAQPQYSPSAQPQYAPSTQPQYTQAAPVSQRSQPRILDEIKFGGVAHDVALGGHHRESGADINLEMVFASPDIFKYIWSPRPLFGVDINTNGNTSNYYFGLGWDWDFWQPRWNPNDGFFFSLAVGGAVHDGNLGAGDPKRKALGSRALFREGIDIGYHFNERISLMAFVDHISNANLADHNEGLTNAGARIGYRF